MPARILVKIVLNQVSWGVCCCLHHVAFALLHMGYFCLYLELLSYFNSIWHFSVYKS